MTRHCTIRPALQAVAATLLCGAALSCRSMHGSGAMNQEHHTIDYIEFQVSDLAAAKRFYGTAFGWTFQDYGPDYAGIQRPGGGEVGGMEQVPNPSLGGPLVVLFSDDLGASVEAVRRAGGTIVKEPFSFPGGRRFHFRDPSGNELAVWAHE